MRNFPNILSIQINSANRLYYCLKFHALVGNFIKRLLSIGNTEQAIVLFIIYARPLRLFCPPFGTQREYCLHSVRKHSVACPCYNYGLIHSNGHNS